MPDTPTIPTRSLGRSDLTMHEAMGYVHSLPGVSTTVIGCETIEQVDENVRIAREFVALTPDEMQDLVSRTQPNAAEITYYKKREWEGQLK